MSANEDQLAYWNGLAGGKWVQNQDRLDRIMAPLTDALLQIAVPHRGERVLDVGCGCGDLSLRVAQVVGPDGGLAGVDFSRPMLDHAASRAAGLEALAKIEWLEADAMTHRFPADYDLAISRFGVMFFDDRRRAFANLRAALKPEGRFAFMAWRSRDEVEWFREPLEWIAPVLTGEPSDGEIGPFALADGEATRELLSGLGFRDVALDPIDRTLVIGTSLEESLSVLTTTGPAAALMREADKPLADEARRLMTERVAALSRDGRLELRGATWVYRGFVED